ncbi:hypothetical protein HK414_02925 [Ramlibacter terrae]|uniref:Uncharacterized protein n=1 Tax=Ramlibacter terrae TaxID=2732511 RepID=A0ABX6P0B5_9BURK|nr:hypothetical protein HK414_02925 [Ramlibacter terrae]
MVAVPCAAPLVTVKAGADMPSAASETLSVPTMAAPSSAPVPERSSVKVAASSAGVIVTLTVTVSLTPPEVTV